MPAIGPQDPLEDPQFKKVSQGLTHEAALRRSAMLKSGSSSSAERRVQIDGLRTIAMIAVLYVHFWNPNPALEHVRVSLFFVVSGFLITLILTRARDVPGEVSIANFYVRRSLRLLPALFVAVFTAALFDMQGIRDSILWHLLQISNLYFALSKSWDPWVAAHLWSLNTVEQFYVFCPLLIFFLSRTATLVAFVAIMVGSILLRNHASDIGLDGWFGIMFAFDPIAAGAILALVRDNIAIQSVLRNRLNIILSIFIIFSPFLFALEFGKTESYRILIIYALVSIVSGAYEGFGRIGDIILGNFIVRYFSRISYAVYIYHFPLWWLVAERYPFLYLKNATTFIVMSSITVLIAALSWYLIEQYFDRAKVHFPIRKTENPLPRTS